MHKSFFIILIALGFSACTKTIYIVRHAEKNTTVKNDPALTPEGAQRAKTLAELLKNKKLNAAYSTNTIRTTTTAQPTIANKNLTLQIYNNDTAQNLLKNIFVAKQNALVVGHSNTIIPLLQKMNLKPIKTDVADWEYDNLFIVKYKRYCFDCANPFKIKKVQYKKYGNTSKANLVEPSMK